MNRSAKLWQILRGPMIRPLGKSPIGLPGDVQRTFHSAARRLAEATQNQRRDEDIRAPLIRLVDPQSGQLQGPFKPLDILAKIDRKEFMLLQVTEGPKSVEKRQEWSMNELPICRLVSKRESYKREREKKKTAAPSAPKMFQLTWNVTGNDLSHKVAKARRDLERGHVVRVVVVSKKGTARVIPGSLEEERRLAMVDQLQADLCAPSSEGGGNIARMRSEPLWKNRRVIAELTLDPITK